MTERCGLCKNIHKLKHNFTKGKGFEESHVCDVFRGEKGEWFQEVTENGMCEMFSPKYDRCYKTGEYHDEFCEFCPHKEECSGGGD